MHNTLLLVTWFYKPQAMSVHNCPREHTLVKAMNGWVCSQTTYTSVPRRWCFSPCIIRACSKWRFLSLAEDITWYTITVTVTMTTRAQMAPDAMATIIQVSNVHPVRDQKPLLGFLGSLSKPDKSMWSKVLFSSWHLLLSLVSTKKGTWKY